MNTQKLRKKKPKVIRKHEKLCILAIDMTRNAVGCRENDDIN